MGHEAGICLMGSVPRMKVAASHTLKILQIKSLRYFGHVACWQPDLK